MSSLIFQLNTDCISVATDTLATLPDGSPAVFSTKAMYLPHLRMIVAGTGVAGIMGQWVQQMNDRMVLSGILNVAFHAPTNLRRIWAIAQAEYDLAEDQTATIYHLGISEENETFGFMSRSTNNFCSEVLRYGWEVKPECEFPEGETDLKRGVQTMMAQQRSIQASKPANERIYIGGECMIWHLTRNNCVSFKAFEFSDHKDQRAQALKSF
jgi:hypothetical protein